jgi:uncharacterized protein YecE (DUF72 family)
MAGRKAGIFVGTSGWHYDDWKGVFYPEKLARSKWLRYYGDHFNTVEINATFYRTFKEGVFTGWAGQVPDGFRFVIKAPRLITHRKYLSGVQESIERFCGQTELLGDKFGLILLQLAPNTPVDPSLLEGALSGFGGHRVAVEFRDDRWLSPRFRGILEKAGAVFCAVDSPVMRIRDWVTSDTAYIRLHGRTKWYDHRYTDGELGEIARHVDEMVSAGAGTVYVFFNNDVHGHAPGNASALKKILGEAESS